ncbi:MAG: hypothetical protein ACQESP_01185 [Candidatus Muiribacteriota bacterium]
MKFILLLFSLIIFILFISLNQIYTERLMICRELILQDPGIWYEYPDLKSPDTLLNKHEKEFKKIVISTFYSYDLFLKNITHFINEEI